MLALTTARFRVYDNVEFGRVLTCYHIAGRRQLDAVLRIRTSCRQLSRKLFALQPACQRYPLLLSADHGRALCR